MTYNVLMGTLNPFHLLTHSPKEMMQNMHYKVSEYYKKNTCGVRDGQATRNNIPVVNPNISSFQPCFKEFTLPYLMGKACYRLALRPPVGPMNIPKLTLRVTRTCWSF